MTQGERRVVRPLCPKTIRLSSHRFFPRDWKSENLRCSSYNGSKDVSIRKLDSRSGLGTIPPLLGYHVLLKKCPGKTGLGGRRTWRGETGSVNLSGFGSRHRRVYGGRGTSERIICVWDRYSFRTLRSTGPTFGTRLGMMISSNESETPRVKRVDTLP